MPWLQKTVKLTEKSRGFHLVTDEILQQVPELRSFSVGMAHFFLQHTSASIGITENADAAVRRDLERYFSSLAAEDAVRFEHTCEGPDDMPAHVKSAMLGCELHIPISGGRLALGTWQGICLGEHRNSGGRRSVVVTLVGEE